MLTSGKRIGIACAALALCFGTQQEVRGSYVRKSATNSLSRSLSRRVKALESKFIRAAQNVASAISASVTARLRPNPSLKTKPGLLSLDVPPSAKQGVQTVTITGSVEDLLQVAIDGMYQGQMTGVHGDTASDVDAIKGDADIDLTKFNLESIVKGDNTSYPSNLDSANLVDLAASSEAGLTPRVSALETTVGSASGGLVKDVSDIKGTTPGTHSLTSLGADVTAIKGNVNPSTVNLQTLNATVGNASSGLVKDVSDIKGATPGTHSLTSLGAIVTANNLTSATNAMGNINTINSNINTINSTLGTNGISASTTLSADLTAIKGDAALDLSKYNLKRIIMGNNTGTPNASFAFSLDNCNLYDIGGASASPVTVAGTTMNTNAPVNAKKLNLLTLNRGDGSDGIGASKRTGVPKSTDIAIPNASPNVWAQ